jgi:hypothetical protein
MKRGGGGQRAEVRQQRGPDRREARADQRRSGNERPTSGRSASKRDRSADARVVERGNAQQRGNGNGAGKARLDANAGRDLVRGNAPSVLRQDNNRLVGSGFACPPGLAAKNNGCLPPGQAKRLVGLAAPATLGAALLPSLYRSWYPDDDRYFYRAENGYVYRIDRERSVVDGFFPLYDDFTGDYYVGATYPQDYLGYYNVPVQYRPWYEDSGDDYYRYGDGAIYRVDRGGGLIEAVVSLLAGDLALGQPLPAGYDVYNVPYDYRDRYADGPDALYRYGDGNIYQVDPTTRLVQAIVETLV